MRELRKDNVLMKVFLKEQYALLDGELKIEMAEAYKHVHPVAEVVLVGKDHDQASGIVPGDSVLLPFHDVMSVVNKTDYVTQKIDGVLHIRTWTHLVQAVITDKAKEQIMKGKKYIDWRNNARPVGRKVFIQLDDQKEVTDGGVIIPSIAKSATTTGVITGLGPDANSYFFKDELEVGLRVLLPEKRSGGELPYQDYKKGLLIRVNPSEVIAAHRDGEWAPVGGRIMVEPVIPEMEKTKFSAKGLTGSEIHMEGYRIAGSTIIAPGNIQINPTIGIVRAVGRGYSKDYASAVSEGYDGEINYGPGDQILMRPTYNSRGQIQFGNEHIKIGEKTYILLTANFVDAVIEGEDIRSEVITTDLPDAEFASGIDKLY